MKKDLNVTKLALLTLPAIGAFMDACQDDPVVTTRDPAIRATGIIKPGSDHRIAAVQSPTDSL